MDVFLINTTILFAILHLLCASDHQEPKLLLLGKFHPSVPTTA